MINLKNILFVVITIALEITIMAVYSKRVIPLFTFGTNITATINVILAFVASVGKNHYI
jgi:hypothetical protein